MQRVRLNFIPLTIGMVSRAVAPASSERFAGYASGVAGVALAVASLALLATSQL